MMSVNMLSSILRFICKQFIQNMAAAAATAAAVAAAVSGCGRRGLNIAVGPLTALCISLLSMHLFWAIFANGIHIDGIPGQSANAAFELGSVGWLAGYDGAGTDAVGNISSNESETTNTTILILKRLNDSNQFNEYEFDDEIVVQSNLTTALTMLFDNLTKYCLQQCSDEESFFTNEFVWKCPAEDGRPQCFRARCSRGCHNWWPALQEGETCSEVCFAKEFDPYDLSCMAACEKTQRQFWRTLGERIRPLILNISPPYWHQIDNFIPEIIVLQWPSLAALLEAIFSSFLDYNQLLFNIQYQYAEEGVESDRAAMGDFRQDVGKSWQNSGEFWWDLLDYYCKEAFDCEITDGLIPFTGYRFRYKLVLNPNSEDVLYSPASSVYYTKAVGEPLSAPTILHVLPLDYRHVAVVWRPGRFSNGPLVNYKLILEAIENLEHTNKDSARVTILPANYTNYIFHNLTSNTKYKLSISMMNNEGEGPAAEIILQTSPRDKFVDFQEFNFLIITDDTRVILKAWQTFDHYQVLYRANSAISDIDVCLYTKHLIILDDLGGVYSLFLDNPDEVEKIELNYKVHFKPEKISIDWLNQQLYIAGSGSFREWQIISKDLNDLETKVIVRELRIGLRQIEVDPLNGWLFFLDIQGKLWRLDLSTLALAAIMASSNNYDFLRFSLDHTHWWLIAYNQLDEALYELSYFDHYVQRLTPPKSLSALNNFKHIAEQVIIVANETHWYYYNSETHVRMDNGLFDQINQCRHIIPIWSHPERVHISQPLPRPRLKPGTLQAVAGINLLKVSWLPSTIVTDFQTQHAWQLWNYELQTVDVTSNSTFNIRNINTTSFQIERLQPNNRYEIKVRATSSWSRYNSVTLVSDWSPVIEASTWPLGQHRLLWASEAGFYETDMIGSSLHYITDVQSTIYNLVQINNTIIYNTNNQLNCLNKIHPNLNCPIVLTAKISSFDYDWKAGKLYWSDREKNCVLRATWNDLNNFELLPISDVQQLQLHSEDGWLYFTTTNRLARRTLSGVANTSERTYYHSPENGKQIISFVLGSRNKFIYWLVREAYHEQTVLYKSHTENLTRFSTVVNHEVLENSLQYLPEIMSLMWLNAKGTHLILVNEMFQDNSLHYSTILTPLNSTVYAVKPLKEFTPQVEAAVCPEAVASDSIVITNSFWNELYIKWAPVQSSQRDSLIFYKVMLSSNLYNESFIKLAEVTEPKIYFQDLQLLQTKINISITASTYWCQGPAVSVVSSIAQTVLKEPRNLRVFTEVTVDSSSLEINLVTHIRWDPPINITRLTAKNIFYKIYCWLENQLIAVRDQDHQGAQTHETKIFGLKDQQSYKFEVYVMLEGYADLVDNFVALRCKINSKEQKIPRLIYTTSEYIAEWDFDLNRTRILLYTASPVEYLTSIQFENRLIWVSENVELLTGVVDHIAVEPIVKLVRMRAEVLALTVDWIQRIVYWAEVALVDEDQQAVDIFKIDLCQYKGQIMQGIRITRGQQNQMLTNLIILPKSQSLIWLQDYKGNQENKSLQAFYINTNTQVNLQFNSSIQHIFMDPFVEVNSNENILLLGREGNLESYNIQRELSTQLITKVYENNENVTSALWAMDSIYLYTKVDQSVLKAINHRKLTLEYVARMSEEVRVIHINNYQTYPKKFCLIPSSLKGDLNGGEVIGETWILLNFSQLIINNNCTEPIPGILFHINITNNNGTERQFHSQGTVLNITDLLPFTRYSFHLKISSYYQQIFNLSTVEYPTFSLHTSQSAPTKPRNFSVVVLSPTEVVLSWEAPMQSNANQLTYEIHCHLEDGTAELLEKTENLTLTLNNLESSRYYWIWLEAFTLSNKRNSTDKKLIKTLSQPNQLQLLDQQAYNLTFSWLSNSEISEAYILYYPLGYSDKESLVAIQLAKDLQASEIIISNLQPKTKYLFYLKVLYKGVERPYIWPYDPHDDWIYETLAAAPGQPGEPKIQHLTGEIFKIFWTKAENNGANITEYSLEALQAHPHHPAHQPYLPYQHFVSPNVLLENHSVSQIDNEFENYLQMNEVLWVEELPPLEDKWLLYCNTTQLSCLVHDVFSRHLLLFRVRARNEPYGWGPYSPYSQHVHESFVLSHKRPLLHLAIVTPAVIVATCIMICIILKRVQKRHTEIKKELLHKNRTSIWNNLTLMKQQQQQQLQQQPLHTASQQYKDDMKRNRTFSLVNNSISVGRLSDADIALLPHINWHQISLLRFLGGGEFGEVYKGLWQQPNQTPAMRVAVKTLNRTCTNFGELLLEAQLMSKFQHKNIVNLIGVCCTSDIIAIVMEFMEGGDLLNYLLEARTYKLNFQKSARCLQLKDLVTMCMDVASGMSYLAALDFIHCNLKCDNCLVSTDLHGNLLVKISNFNLLHDTAGGSLKLIRWLAPECIIDGVFSTASDIWSYGILCWQVLTLGQQPYNGFNDMEVMKYIKSGGRLRQPSICPTKLFQLLEDCWQLEKEKRPSFTQCLNRLLAIKTDIRRGNSLNIDQLYEMDNIVFNDVTDNTAQSNLQHRSIPESKESFKDCNKNASTELIDCQDYKILQTNADIYINESITRL